MYTTEANRIEIDAFDFDVKATLDCGQLFRYEKTVDGYVVKSGEHSCYVRTNGDKVIVDTQSVDYFVNYFNLDRDVLRVKRELARFPELGGALEMCGALRILHQPLFETIISFIISANNGIARTKSIISRVCAEFGDVFPTPSRLADLGDRQLTSLGCGYKAQYIIETAEICAKTDILGRMYSASTADARKLLMSLPGVGSKIADYVLLYALGRHEACPIGNWVFKALRIGMETELQLRARLMDRYGGCAGYVQQLLYYYHAILKRG